MQIIIYNLLFQLRTTALMCRQCLFIFTWKSTDTYNTLRRSIGIPRGQILVQTRKGHFLQLFAHFDLEIFDQLLKTHFLRNKHLTFFVDFIKHFFGDGIHFYIPSIFIHSFFEVIHNIHGNLDLFCIIMHMMSVGLFFSITPK